MSKTRTLYRCSDCGADVPKWVGQCPGCEGWGTMVEELASASASSTTTPVVSERPPRPISSVDLTEHIPRPTGIDELDLVLGGGLVAGSVSLLGGEPGIGKSTLMLQMAASVARAGTRVLYISGEESPQQVRLRAERLQAIEDQLYIGAETALPQVLGSIQACEPGLVVIDSIQTVSSPDLASVPGSVAQVRECAHRLVPVAKQGGCSVVLVGHVTKDGNLAGPRVLEHLVDTVLSFEGDRHHSLRMLRAVKHRFGSTEELGLFEMAESGLQPLADPSGTFLADRRPGLPGSVVVPAIEGGRPLMVEIQALVTASPLSQPRRQAQGLDHGRLGLVAAVMAQMGSPLVNADVHVAAVGGVKVVEPGADLGLAMALASATHGVAVADDLVACGEVGLGGELRQVPHASRRLTEAARLGFRRALVPASAPEPPPGIKAIRAATLSEGLAVVGLS